MKNDMMGANATRLSPSRLLLFNVCSTSACYAAGDLIQQRFERRRVKKTNDWPRTGRMAIVGAPMAVMNHYWYILLDRVLPGTAGRTIAKKVLADQGIYGPICLSAFIVGKQR